MNTKSAAFDAKFWDARNAAASTFLPAQPAAANGEDIEAAVAAMLAKITPATAAQVADHREKTRVQPWLRECGFRAEHLAPLPAPSDQRGREQAAALAKVRARLALHPNAIIALVGPRGTGKTQMAAEIARDYIGRSLASEDALRDWQPDSGTPRPCVFTFDLVYRKASSLFIALKEAFGAGGTINAKQLLIDIETLAKVDFLAIDELQEPPENFLRILTDLVDRRYTERRATLLLSNHYDAEDRGLFSRAIGDSIASRMGQYGGIIECAWPSFRRA